MSTNRAIVTPLADGRPFIQKHVLFLAAVKGKKMISGWGGVLGNKARCLLEDTDGQQGETKNGAPDDKTSSIGLS